MKKSLVVTLVAAALAGTLSAAAQAQVLEQPELSCPGKFAQADLSQIEKRYLPCLRSENDGVVESALGHVTQMKLCLPDVEFAQVQGMVIDLSVDGRTPAIRAKAQLASLVYRSPELFVAEHGREFQTMRELFTALAERVSKTLLAGNGPELASR
jgi:hypothetical protein